MRFKTWILVVVALAALVGVGYGGQHLKAWLNARFFHAAEPAHPQTPDLSALQGMKVAITYDDITVEPAAIGPSPPRNRKYWGHVETREELLTKLIKQLKDGGVEYAVGVAVGKRFDQHLAELWLEAGFELGNHTYSHPSADEVSLQAFIEDVERCAQLVDPVCVQYGQHQRYFRFPYHREGKSEVKRENIARYLISNGYLIAPATIKTFDYQFNKYYRKARTQDDTTAVEKIKRDFFEHLRRETIQARIRTREEMGRDVLHIAVFHAKQFTCDYMGEIIAWFRSNGISFISLKEALADPYYARYTTIPEDDEQ